jgi:hypothetical protein
VPAASTAVVAPESVVAAAAGSGGKMAALVEQ